MAKPPPTFASLEGLLDHGRQDGFDIRPTLLRVLTDFYLQKPAHPLEDERHYTELALRLINSTDLPTRTAVAERLASYPSAPHQVVMRLARDVIGVAEPILKHSPCLTPADLELIIADCGPAHAAVIAARPRPDGPQARNAHLPAGTEGRFDKEAAELSELFFSAGGAERRLILINLDYAAPVSFELAATTPDEIVRRLETAALRHNVEAFTREIEFAFGISNRLARRIATDELGEPIVVAAKALRAPRAVLERILLFVNPQIGQSVQRVHELATRYDEISLEGAQRLVAIWRNADPREQARPGRQQFSRRPAAGLGRPAISSAARRPPERIDQSPRTVTIVR
jgi:hypothetical protein